jgi:hypothetical protein
MIGSFMPQGSTVAITSAVTSTAAVQVPNAQGSAGLGPSDYLLNVVGAVPVFVQFTTIQTYSANGNAAAAAVIPVPGTPTTAIPVAPGVPQVVTIAPGCYVTSIATATTSTLYITPGQRN